MKVVFIWVIGLVAFYIINLKYHVIQEDWG